MSRVVVVNSLSLDGVMQAPGRADEDSRGGLYPGGVGAALRRSGHGRGDGRRDGPDGGAAARPADLPGFRRRLAGPEGQSVHRGAAQHAEVRRVEDAAGAAAG
jgi:hypothetical protein